MGPGGPLDLRAGQVVERYEVERLLGRGGQAVVYLVNHTQLGSRHALKVIPTVSGPTRDRLIREGRIQSGLAHPHIVVVTDVIDVGGHPGLVMEFVDGPTLAAWAGTRPERAEMEAVFESVVRGIAAAHARGVVHRDLKPSNILLSRASGRWSPKVTDFGLAKALRDVGHHDHTGTGSYIGTPRYMAPEQILDAKGVDERADLFSLGCILYELVCGRPAFPQPQIPQVVHAITSGSYLPPRSVVPDLPEHLSDVVTACLAVDPAARVPSCDALLGMLSAEDTGASTLWQADAGVPVASNDHRHNLPRERDTFVGREADLAELHARIEAGAHLVSLLGAGGTGKTRLALHYGWQQIADWPGGVWFCDLSEARSVPAIASAVARALDVPLGNEDPIVQLGHAIAGHGRCLLILDNFEQVAEHAGETVGPWLDRAGDARFVVTTRETLRLRGEEVLELEPLTAREGRVLFVTRAGAVRQDFAPSEGEQATIESLVRLLDGLPLAIELAAARVRVLPIDQIHARMRDRFKLLAGRQRERDRHTTLRAALDWSWDLLEPWEKAALAQCSVFDGGFTLEATEAILDLSRWTEAPWTMDVVQALVDKSLVRHRRQDRLGLLVSIGEYASEKLRKEETYPGSGPTASDAVELRHGAYYAAWGEPDAIASVAVRGGEQHVARLVADLDNLIAACVRAIARRDGPMAADLLCAAWEVLERRIVSVLSQG